MCNALKNELEAIIALVLLYLVNNVNKKLCKC